MCVSGRGAVLGFIPEEGAAPGLEQGWFPQGCRVSSAQASHIYMAAAPHRPGWWLLRRCCPPAGFSSVEPVSLTGSRPPLSLGPPMLQKVPPDLPKLTTFPANLWFFFFFQAVVFSVLSCIAGPSLSLDLLLSFTCSFELYWLIFVLPCVLTNYTKGNKQMLPHLDLPRLHSTSVVETLEAWRVETGCTWA